VTTPSRTREQRVRRGVRLTIATLITLVALRALDPAAGARVTGTVILTLLALRFLVSRGWEQEAKHAVAVVLGLIVVATYDREPLPLWAPTTIILLLGPLPFLIAFTEDFLHYESPSARRIIAWGMWRPARRIIRYTSAAAAWIVAWRTGDGWAPVLLAVPAFLSAAGYPVPALLVLAAAAPIVGGTTGWWSVAAVAVVLAVAHRRVPPPKRAIGLPRASIATVGLRGQGVLRAIDRRLRRSQWQEAAGRSDAFLRRGGRGTAVVALRLARARMEQGDVQAALDALKSAAGSVDRRISAAALRLRGEVLIRAAQPVTALDVLAEARLLLPDDAEHQARVSLAAAEALLETGRVDDALVHARAAGAWFRGRRFLEERLRAARLTATALWRLDQLDNALLALDDVLGIVLSVRWLRQYMGTGRGARDDSELVASPAAVLLVEFARTQVLELQVKRDPRLPTDEAQSLDDLLDDLEGFSTILDMAGAGIHRAEVELVRAEVLAAHGRAEQALGSTLAAIADLDEMRHRLRAQADRASWSVTCNRALAMALEMAVATGDSRRVAELIELARVQAFPIIGTGGGTEEVSLQAPPTVRVRGRASILRGSIDSIDDPTAPVDLEGAAGCAAGSGAWWLSYWHDGFTLTWALVPPTGPISHGRLPGDRYDDLRHALADLDRNLPIPLDGESDADVDFRLFTAAFRREPNAERTLSVRLGELLLPEALQHEAVGRYARGEPALALAIAPDPLLAHVPWALLAMTAEPARDGDRRLAELVSWTLAPSATLLVLTSERPLPSGRAPLRLAVLDPADVPSLPAAQALAGQLQGVRVLGGRHWGAEPATPAAVLEAMAAAGPDSTVLFGCHAVRGDVRRPSTSALVLAADAPDARAAHLSAGALFSNPIPASSFPGQVSLQACDTSDLASATSGEWLSLAPAFLVAGARVVATTQYPLIDVSDGDGPSPLVQALLDGSDLAEAVRREQIDGLRRWRLHDGGRMPPVADTPLSWGAYAIVSTGRSRQAGATAVRPSSSFIGDLRSAADFAGSGSTRTVTSAHVLFAYLEDSELIAGSLLTELTGLLKAWLCAKVLRAARAPGSQRGARPSGELLSALDRAARLAAQGTGWLETSHLVQAVVDGPPSPGLRLLAAVHLHRSVALRRTLRSDLQDALLRPPHAPADASEADSAFVAECLARIGAGATGRVA
jgi:tetratricopeptide (TPR) repeat protein